MDGPDDALFVLKEYLSLGLTKSKIVNLMVDRGAPIDWIEDEIRGLGNR